MAVAQLVEHLIAIQKVASSNLVSHSIKLGVYSKPNLVNKKISKFFLSRFEPYKFMRLDTTDTMKS